MLGLLFWIIKVVVVAIILCGIANIVIKVCKKSNK